MSQKILLDTSEKRVLGFSEKFFYYKFIPGVFHDSYFV